MKRIICYLLLIFLCFGCTRGNYYIPNQSVPGNFKVAYFNAENPSEDYEFSGSFEIFPSSENIKKFNSKNPEFFCLEFKEIYAKFYSESDVKPIYHSFINIPLYIENSAFILLKEDGLRVCKNAISEINSSSVEKCNIAEIMTAIVFPCRRGFFSDKILFVPDLSIFLTIENPNNKLAKITYTSPEFEKIFITQDCVQKEKYKKGYFDLIINSENGLQYSYHFRAEEIEENKSNGNTKCIKMLERRITTLPKDY